MTRQAVDSLMETCFFLVPLLPVDPALLPVDPALLPTDPVSLPSPKSSFFFFLFVKDKKKRIILSLWKKNMISKNKKRAYIRTFCVLAGVLISVSKLSIE